MSDATLPDQARVVIVGGGIMGVGLAYHLAHEGWGNETVLLEKAELTSGSTWHAAGQITQSTSSFALGKCVDYNIKLYSGELERETGQAVTWHGCGSYRLAYSEDEMDWLLHTLSVGRSLGFNMEIADPAHIAKNHPFYNLDGVLGALYTPDDGHVDPTNATMAMAAGARKLGATIIRQCRATNIVRDEKNDEWLVETARGTIRCEHVVNAGGTYARQMGEWSGLLLPMTSMTHHYFVTEPVPEFENLDRELPVIRDDRMVSGYIRMEQKRGLIGVYEKKNPNPVWIDHCPWDCENWLFDPDYDRVLPWLEAGIERMPVFADLGIARVVHGAISHPPDGNPHVGPAPGANNYWCCCGTQIGIGWGPGLSRELARWIVHGSADISMREFDPRRFGDYATRDWQVAKSKEDYMLRHEIPYPHYNRPAARPAKPSFLYERLRERGAVFEEVHGHERPRWFAKNGVEQRDHYSFRRNVVHEIVGEECRAVRTGAGIVDISAFAKVEVCGPGSGELLDRLIANRLPSNRGSIALGHMLNHCGRIELEATIIKMAEERYYLVCAAFFERRLLDHLHGNSKDAGITITSKSDSWSALALNGPRSRDVLGRCTTAGLCNESFPWLSARNIKIANHDIWALRMSYAGELGWELHMPSNEVSDVYDAILSAGAECGIADYGSFAMNSMRMEKMFKGASELTNEVTLPEADVMRFVSMDKEFVGCGATRASAENARVGKLPWICAYLEIEPDGVFDGHGGEAIFADGKPAGSISSIAYGHSTGKILAFAYIRPELNAPGREIGAIIAGKPRKGRVLGGPVHDPESRLPRSGEPAAVQHN